MHSNLEIKPKPNPLRLPQRRIFTVDSVLDPTSPEMSTQVTTLVTRNALKYQTKTDSE